MDGESNSITNQKAILSKYAADHGFTNTKFYVDDGTSGTVFNREGLNAMIDDVKADRVAVVIIKDQSRIGRDVLEVGLLRRTFEEHNVRYIAASDGLDSANGFDIMSIFRDVINEWYVAEATSH
jgi:DNA invertase Pin-like site-specific DNA recombinase